MGVNWSRLIFASVALVLLALGMSRWIKQEPSGLLNPAADAVFLRLQQECDPGNPNADYAWATSAPPTERQRLALLDECRNAGMAWLPSLSAWQQRAGDSELGQMLQVAALAMGDRDQRLPVCHLMAWSDHPAVRVCAARELRRLRDPRVAEWFESALDDDRFVLNSDCGTGPERFYPVRVVAELALRDLGQR